MDQRARSPFDPMGLVEDLYPIARSITGDGVRETLRLIGEHVPVEVHEVASGTPVLDWTVPPEWNLRDAYIADSAGNRVVDARASNLHVVGYSVPVHATMGLDELRPHLHTLPEQPHLVPYRTSYYEETWGFCVAQATLDALAEDQYEVCIDSTLAPGSLTYGEVVVPGDTGQTGDTGEEILLSAHLCHPSLADDNLSGLAVATAVARRLLAAPLRRYTVRVLFAPGTIGAITWLARNRDRLDRLAFGLTLSCLGDHHPFTYKRTHQADTPIDHYVAEALSESGHEHELIDYFPYGYDERQYNSPGFRLAVGSLMRGRHGQFPEYHTSADDLGFVSGERMSESIEVLERVLRVADRDRVLWNLAPRGEPQLGRRGLYRALGGTDIDDAQLAMLWVLHLCDGDHTLLDVARRAGLAFDAVAATAEVLEHHGLLGAAPPAATHDVPGTRPQEEPR